MPWEAHKIRPVLVGNGSPSRPKNETKYGTPWKCVPTAAWSLGFRRLATLPLLILVPFRRIFFPLFQHPQNFPEQHLVFQIDLIIQIGPQPVLLRFAILRHHDDRRLQRRHHPENKIKQDKRKYIEPFL